MVARQYRVKPPIDPNKDLVTLGPGSAEQDGLWLGALAEETKGRPPQVWLTTSKEQVVAVVGKRGSGKSFTLGVIAEGLGGGSNTNISRQDKPRAVLLLDPLDVYWTTRHPVTSVDNPDDNLEIQRHYKLARNSGLATLCLDVQAWVPGDRNRRPTDPEWFQTLRLPVPSLGLEEWELLLDVNVLTQPMGQALVDSIVLVKETGYSSGGERIHPSQGFGLPELANAVQSDDLDGVYHKESLRALRQRLLSLHATGLFSNDGTPLSDLLVPGRVSVILLERLPDSYRTAVVSVLTRRAFVARGETAFAEKRLALDPDLNSDTRKTLEDAVALGVPKTVIVLDEAQSFLAPGPSSPAREVFVRLVKEGRNIGLSATLATQQPSALDRRILSQVETFIAHQLVTESDIKAVRDNLKSGLPESINFGRLDLDLAGTLRHLDPGVCFVSSADMNTMPRRAVIVAIRPRATVHGGIEL